jgi:hypothetical protein
MGAAQAVGVRGELEVNAFIALFRGINVGRKSTLPMGLSTRAVQVYSCSLWSGGVTFGA